VTIGEKPVRPAPRQGGSVAALNASAAQIRCGLVSGFLASCEQHPHRPALYVNKTTLTYEQLAQQASALAATIAAAELHTEPLAAVFAYRSVTAYAGVLGILMAGKGYVPLHPHFPPGRTREMLLRSGANTIILGSEALSCLDSVLEGVERALLLICPDLADVESLRHCWPRHRFIASGEIAAPPTEYVAREVDPAGCAYLLFTSGSTGTPKGVPVSHTNVLSYVDYISSRYSIGPEDRASQAPDISFDLSVHDLFVTWANAACLCVLPQQEIMAPAQFITDNKLTLWVSVPSVIMFLSRMHLLKPGVFSTLRLSLFCGEPLPAALATQWQKAAPNSVVENLYGPTEATVAISHYRWTSHSPQECRNGVVPIGTTFTTQRSAIIDEHRRPLPDGEPGELCLAGAQVTRGYLNAPELTAAQYIHVGDDPETIWYRTGDRVVRDSGGCMHFLGRIDNQVQIRGYRVELQEIEHVVRRAAGTETAVALAFPVRDGCAEGVHVFVCGPEDDSARVRVLAECAKSLPDYMIPRSVRFKAKLPMNANGKIDRRELTACLENAGNE
jgi:amino acid adenylation domain-containing protein